MINDAIPSFLLAFSALFSIVNPFGGAIIYSQVTADRSHADRVALAWRIAAYSAVVMLTALWAGAPILSFFGISLAALRIAGGLVVAARAWELLLGPEQQEDRKQEQAAPAVAHASRRPVGAARSTFTSSTLPSSLMRTSITTFPVVRLDCAAAG